MPKKYSTDGIRLCSDYNTTILFTICAVHSTVCNTVYNKKVFCMHKTHRWPTRFAKIQYEAYNTAHGLRHNAMTLIFQGDAWTRRSGTNNDHFYFLDDNWMPLTKLNMSHDTVYFCCIMTSILSVYTRTA